MAKKSNTITIIDGGFILRSHNKRVSVKINKDGKYYVEALHKQNNEEEHPTCTYHRMRGVDCTRILMTEEMIMGLAKGVDLLNRLKTLIIHKKEDVQIGDKVVYSQSYLDKSKNHSDETAVLVVKGYGKKDSLRVLQEGCKNTKILHINYLRKKP